MAGSYSNSQIIHSFSFSSNSPGGLTFSGSGGQSAFQEMQAYVTKVSKDILANTTIQGYIGSDWVPVWGPVVWANERDNTTAHADNTMGAYYSPSLKLFIIAIAGTNPNSPYGWIDEDFDVATTVTWESITGVSGGSVSQGTATGLNILLTMEDPNNSNVTLLNALKNYISTNSITSAELAVAGHSLGGALSPTLALYLSDMRSSWDPSGVVSLSTYPTAGPTPGNSTFVKHYEKEIADNKIAYTSLYNPIDSVPQAWELDTLANIPTLYESDIPATENPVIGTVSAGLGLLSLKGSGFLALYPYKQICPWTSLTGSAFNTTVDDSVTKVLKPIYKYALPKSLQAYYDNLVNVARFAAQAAAQHTIAYSPLLDITDFMTEYDAILANNKPTTATSVDLINEAVKNASGVDLETFDVEAMEELSKSATS